MLNELLKKLKGSAARLAIGLWKRGYVFWVQRGTVFLLLIFVACYAAIYFFDASLTNEHAIYSHIIIVSSNVFFGVVGVAGFLVSLQIYQKINPFKFSSAQELLGHCIDLFEDAIKYKCPVHLLTLFPNPGQFDECFNLSKRKHKFSKLKEQIALCVSGEIPGVSVNMVCLDGDPSDRGSNVHDFLTLFYLSECDKIETWRLEAHKDREDYIGDAAEFKTKYLSGNNLSVTTISPGHWSDIRSGSQMFVGGYAHEEAFLGTISFDQGKYKFQGIDLGGDDITAVKELYNWIVAKYVKS